MDPSASLGMTIRWTVNSKGREREGDHFASHGMVESGQLDDKSV